MPDAKDERSRILRLIEDRQVTAEQASQLLDALDELDAPVRPGERRRNPIIHVRTTGLNERKQKIVVNANLPLSLLRISLRLGLIPQVNGRALDELLGAIEKDVSGRLLDVQDLERGERVEIFVEQ